MTEEKWKTIVGNIKDGFEVEDEGSEHIDDEGGVDIEYIVFQGPLGRMRLELVTKPVVLDKKTTYSRRIGAETKIDYVYSEEDRSSQMTAYKWDENDQGWVEMEAGMFSDH